MSKKRIGRLGGGPHGWEGKRRTVRRVGRWVGMLGVGHLDGVEGCEIYFDLRMAEVKSVSTNETRKGRMRLVLTRC
jgi:hypothetical protein